MDQEGSIGQFVIIVNNSSYKIYTRALTYTFPNHMTTIRVFHKNLYILFTKEERSNMKSASPREVQKKNIADFRKK
jgi:hypothetical protein